MSIEVKNNELYFAKTIETAIIPMKRKEDAGYDCFIGNRNKSIIIFPSTNEIIDTGIATAYSDEYTTIFFDKSGFGSKNITVTGGVFDSGYRGSYYVSLSNLNKDKYLIFTNKFEESEEIMKNKYTHYDLQNMKFISEIRSPYDITVIPVEKCIIKNINKSIIQIVVLPVPKMEIKEISFDELQSIPSERKDGKFGSTNV